MGVDEGIQPEASIKFIKTFFLLNHQVSAQNNFHNLKNIYVTT